MPQQRSIILAVPTNVITGFLGVGKTSAILNLLAQKPADERWAVLVNEFGEIGVDGGLITGQTPDPAQVFVAEVPGGCMCCAAGLPMQVALNQLLRRAQPHRLLIEPTGLGHPLEVIQTLLAPEYQEVLNLQKTLTLVDARHFLDERYLTHDTFLQQLEIADVIVANKQDVWGTLEFGAMQAFLDAHLGERDWGRPRVRKSQQGQLALVDLDGACHSIAAVTSKQPHQPHHRHNEPIAHQQGCDLCRQ